MKIINQKNFFPTVCVIYTILSLSKIFFEWIALRQFGNLQLDFLEMFAITVIATLVLSQYYRLQKFPLLPVIIGQYAAIMALVMLWVWCGGHFVELHPNAYRDMFVSVTVPYMMGAAVYYVYLFAEMKQANMMIETIKKSKEKGGSNHE